MKKCESRVVFVYMFLGSSFKERGISSQTLAPKRENEFFRWLVLNFLI